MKVMDIAADRGNVVVLDSDPRSIAEAVLRVGWDQPAVLSVARLRVLLSRRERRLRTLSVAGGVDPPKRARFQHMQALEDAIKYRRIRVTLPCRDCDAVLGGRCDDHGRDIDLIAAYARTLNRLAQGQT